MVPCATSTTPVSSNCTGPTKLRLVSEGGGPKYDRGTVVPMEAGAGNSVHPGPGPIGPGPGPWSELNVVDVAVAAAAIVRSEPAGDAAVRRFANVCMAMISGGSGRLTWVCLNDVRCES